MNASWHLALSLVTAAAAVGFVIAALLVYQEMIYRWRWARRARGNRRRYKTHVFVTRRSLERHCAACGCDDRGDPAAGVLFEYERCGGKAVTAVPKQQFEAGEGVDEDRLLRRIKEPTVNIARLAGDADMEVAMSGKGDGLSALRRLASLPADAHPIVRRARKALLLAEAHRPMEDDLHRQALAALAYNPEEFSK